MRFTKMHGLGNDFIVIEAEKSELSPEDYSRTAIKLCDRHFGIGGDGLVIVGKDRELDVFMRIFNPDGSEPEMCGNAIRCVSKFVWERGLVSTTRISVNTLAGPRYPEVILKNGEVEKVRVDMGEPILERSLIPMLGSPGKVVGEELDTTAGRFRITAVSMGNPHCVVFVDEFSSVPVSEWGPVLENHPVFPSRTNVEFAKIEDENTVSMRVWERGAGETLACGTGACATLVASYLNDLTGRRATVRLKGGELIIEWDPDNNHVYMTGEAKEVFTGEVDLRKL
ncbi:MAG TPA: diaminopimelate epimerase [Syntrophothermus lipocalidus]|uniref:Diaminopimelate epimerase n=1 Tax=Syntrophothermus lipocalidus (strain DSM 12680 / TGB-C1) TaxID=643648 RepID=D7CLP5_SYNLT|nr:MULTISPECIES: diaminopimelate epimerase [Syntrophothermus]ADI01630.1 diaminopimelate epimerase [Syntrophothermus lipocalidus DSM 12680]NSW82250.1 diaminopimelate epimerase [Syntrophothermus sp.]HHV77027.1 diaminopimelate epimerase [Syntrophothermus lipocalidus]HOV43329.1 diaminopimelate epimerase [Syntrophothermus lipocalidus]